MQLPRVAAIGVIILASESADAQPAPTELQPAPAEPTSASGPPPAPTPQTAPNTAPAPNASKPDQAEITVSGYLEA